MRQGGRIRALRDGFTASSRGSWRSHSVHEIAYGRGRQSRSLDFYLPSSHLEEPYNRIHDFFMQRLKLLSRFAGLR
jgi:hypothetical protein